MLNLLTGRKASDCTGVSRREFLRVGGLSALGLSLPTFFRLQQQAAASTPAPRRNATNCILLWMQGGPSHIDTLDPKPNAPAEVRGEFGTIPTRIAGVRVCEHLPLLARQFDKLSLIRGHNPRNGSHGVADHLMMSGRPFNPAMAFPCYGSVVARERGYPGGMFRSCSWAATSTAASTAESAASSATSTTRSRSTRTPTPRLSVSAT
jgi:hypothetical protein